MIALLSPRLLRGSLSGEISMRAEHWREHLHRHLLSESPDLGRYVELRRGLLASMGEEAAELCSRLCARAADDLLRLSFEARDRAVERALVSLQETVLAAAELDAPLDPGGGPGAARGDRAPLLSLELSLALALERIEAHPAEAGAHAARATALLAQAIAPARSAG